LQGYAQQPRIQVSNSRFNVSFRTDNRGFNYHISGSEKSYNFSFLSFEINGKQLPAVVKDIKASAAVTVLSNCVSQYQFQGSFISEPALQLQIIFQVSPDNPVVRFQYALKTTKPLLLTKEIGKDNINYVSVASISSKIKEVRLSEFNERFHATSKTEYLLGEKYFENEAAVMGPIAVSGNGNESLLMAYEHGSQYPDRFLNFNCIVISQ